MSSSGALTEPPSAFDNQARALVEPTDTARQIDSRSLAAPGYRMMFSRTVKTTEAIIEIAIMARQLGRNMRMLVSFQPWKRRINEIAHTDRPRATGVGRYSWIRRRRLRGCRTWPDRG